MGFIGCRPPRNNPQHNERDFVLIIRIELHSARTGKVKEIGRMLIDNISMTGNDSKRGDYRVRLMRRGSNRKVLREGRVENYPRLSYPVWRLLQLALDNVLTPIKRPKR